MSNFDISSNLLNNNLDYKINQIEFLTIIKYIKMYASKDMSILEFNASTGRYTRYLVSKGYKCSAVENNPQNLKIFKKLIVPNKRIRIYKYDLDQYNEIKSESFDMVLLIHSFIDIDDEKTRTKIYKEALRVLKPKGFIYSVYQLTDLNIMKNCFNKDFIYSYLNDGLLSNNIFDFNTSISTIFNSYRKENIDEFLNQFKINRLHMVSLDLLSKSFMKDQISQMDEQIFKLYFKYFLSICERKDMIGMSELVMDISQKQ